LNEVYGDEEVSSNEFLILKFLLQTSSKTVSEISKELDVSPSHITSVSDKLVQKGFVDRYRSHQDRRVVELSITNTGEDVVKKLIEKRKKYMTDKFGKLNDDELDQLILLIEKIMYEKK
jgi:DNA-binding MarR family transcriptional regulator